MAAAAVAAAAAAAGVGGGRCCMSFPPPPRSPSRCRPPRRPFNAHRPLASRTPPAGSAAIIADLATSGRSILLLGRPGVGKTTAIREVARLLASAECQWRRVVVVDTSNEIGGVRSFCMPAWPPACKRWCVDVSHCMLLCVAGCVRRRTATSRTPASAMPGACRRDARLPRPRRSAPPPHPNPYPRFTHIPPPPPHAN